MWFTRSNKRGGQNHYSSRLGLVNYLTPKSKWPDVFTESEPAILAPGVSDPCHVVISVMPYRGGRKLYNIFFYFWMNHSSFSPTLSQSLEMPVDDAFSPMMILLRSTDTDTRHGHKTTQTHGYVIPLKCRTQTH